MGCDNLCCAFGQSRFVSIHAPAWGATVCPIRSLCPRDVSIHAPAWGATASLFLISKFIPSFNPRTRMGCDENRLRVERRRQVSIHAPAWGATGLRIIAPLASLFQSTHPHGVRHKQQYHRVVYECFNPRTRMGCDHKPLPKVLNLSCFNPRTRMGCDHKPLPKVLNLSCFNPRTRMGCDCALSVTEVFITCFNPRTRMGCDFCNQLPNVADL